LSTLKSGIEKKRGHGLVAPSRLEWKRSKRGAARGGADQKTFFVRKGGGK